MLRVLFLEVVRGRDLAISPTRRKADTQSRVSPSGLLAGAGVQDLALSSASGHAGAASSKRRSSVWPAGGSHSASLQAW